MLKFILACHFSFSIFIFIGAAFAQDQSASAPPCPVGQKLEFRHDDGRSFSSVVSREDDLCVVNTDSRKSYYDKDWVLVKVVEPNGKIHVGWEPFTHTEIGQVWMDFPFQVGKTWTRDRKRYRTQSGRTVFEYTLQARYNVLAYEEVKVPGGTFKAFKIKHTATETCFGSECGWGDAKRSGVRYLWYAPEVGYYVKRQADLNESIDKDYWKTARDYEAVSMPRPN
jgi:hypothetical protein